MDEAVEKRIGELERENKDLKRALKRQQMWLAIVLILFGIINLIYVCLDIARN